MSIRPTGETTKKRTMLFTSRWCGKSNDEANFFWKIRKIVENFRIFGKIFLKILKSDGIFQKIRNISKKFLFFT